MSAYRQVIDILAGAKAAITKLLSANDDEHHRLRLEADIDRDITYLSLLTNTENVHEEKFMKAPPATTIGGKPIVRKEIVRPTDLQPAQDKLNVLRQKVDAAYPRFVNMESLFIKNEFEDAVIRGVAKKAKMKVTREDPEKVTLEFIDEIKENIVELERREMRQQQQKQEAELGMTGSGKTLDEKIDESLSKSGFQRMPKDLFNPAAKEEFSENSEKVSEKGTIVSENDQNVLNSDITVRENETASETAQEEGGQRSDIEENLSGNARDTSDIVHGIEEKSNPDNLKDPGQQEISEDASGKPVNEPNGNKVVANEVNHAVTETKAQRKQREAREKKEAEEAKQQSGK